MNPTITLLSQSEFMYYHPDKVAEHYGFEKWAEFVSHLESETPEAFEDGIDYENYSKWHIDKYSGLAKVLE